MKPAQSSTFFFSSRRRHTRWPRDWSSDVCSSDLEVFTWLRQASVFVMPSRYEPFGLSVLEAALSGCALILSDIPTFREVWGASARYIDTESPDHIQQQLKRLTDDRELCREMAARAIQRCRTAE